LRLILVALKVKVTSLVSNPCSSSRYTFPRRRRRYEVNRFRTLIKMSTDDSWFWKRNKIKWRFFRGYSGRRTDDTIKVLGFQMLWLCIHFDRYHMAELKRLWLRICSRRRFITTNRIINWLSISKSEFTRRNFFAF
jgi:hypothetical protein